LDAAAGEFIELRARSLAAKGLHSRLTFRQSPMEYIHDKVDDLPPFDVVYVYEALHHAHDWRKAVKSCYDSLASGGWLFIFNEPNITHTFISYRVGKLSNTHEIGINPSHLRRHLKQVGFSKVNVLKNRFHWWLKPIWIAAQK
jgi:SAM-dependent methyltransferase